VYPSHTAIVSSPSFPYAPHLGSIGRSFSGGLDVPNLKKHGDRTQIWIHVEATSGSVHTSCPWAPDKRAIGSSSLLLGEVVKCLWGQFRTVNTGAVQDQDTHQSLWSLRAFSSSPNRNEARTHNDPSMHLSSRGRDEIDRAVDVHVVL
jgi:hypothetical protein